MVLRPQIPAFDVHHSLDPSHYQTPGKAPDLWFGTIMQIILDIGKVRLKMVFFRKAQYLEE